MVFGVIQFTDTTSVTVDLQSAVSEYQGLRPEMMRRIINPHLKYPRIANPRGQIHQVHRVACAVGLDATLSHGEDFLWQFTKIIFDLKVCCGFFFR